MDNLLLSFGDIIWCSREHKRNIISSDRHKNGPYIVIEQNDGYVYAISGSGFRCNQKIEESDFIIDPNAENGYTQFRKKTVFNSATIEKVEDSRIKAYISSLDKNQIAVLKRKMAYSRNNIPGCYDMLLGKISFELKNGDLVCDDEKKYLIVDDSNQSFNIGVPYIFNEKNSRLMYDLKNKVKLGKYEGELKYIKTLDKRHFESLRELSVAVEMDSNEETIKKDYAPGDVIIANKLLYYICTIENDSYLCYRLIPAPDDGDLVINGKNINVDFKQTKFSINKKSIHSVCTLSDEEIKLVRQLKKEKKSETKKENAKKNYQLEKLKKKNMFGRILKIDNLYNAKFAAYKYENQYYIYVVDLDRLEEGQFVTYSFRLDEITVDKRYTYGDFIEFIKDIKVKIADERYSEFLIRNGIYEINKQNNGVPRIHKKKQS